LKIVLIQPGSGDFNPDHIHEPLNLGYLAGILNSRGFRDVSIIVGAFEQNVDTIIEKANKADVIGLTATTPMVKQALHLASNLREQGRLIVMGGPHASNRPDEILTTDAVDMVVRGEGELVLAQVIEHLNRKRDWRSVDGISFKNGNRIIHNQRPALIENLDILPFPARQLFNQERFLEIGYQRFKDRGAWILSSRGCPNACSFCASREIWGQKWRTRSSENIIKEIMQVVSDFGADRINFADDTFTVSRKRIMEFCRMMTDNRVEVNWGCNIRVDTVDRSLLGLMKSAGCRDIWIGVESGSTRILKSIRKDIELVSVKRVFKWARDMGLKRRGYFMLGIPGETFEDILMTEKLVEELEPDSLAFTFFTPFPGCQAFQTQKEQGFDFDQIDWSGIDFFTTGLAGNGPLSLEEIQVQHQRLYHKFKDIWKK
jgi:anaerobic magnesium-protoporphyrin IX monomethyl ester cyclase